MKSIYSATCICLTLISVCCISAVFSSANHTHLRGWLMSLIVITFPSEECERNSVALNLHKPTAYMIHLHLPLSLLFHFPPLIREDWTLKASPSGVLTFPKTSAHPLSLSLTRSLSLSGAWFSFPVSLCSVCFSLCYKFFFSHNILLYFYICCIVL